MLIDYDLFDMVQSGIIYGFAGLALLLLVAAFWKKRFVFAAGAAVAFVLAVVAIPGPDSFTMPVFLAKGGPANIEFGRAMLVGTHPYRFANGRTVTLQRRPEPTELVLNDTAKTLTISSVTFSLGPMMAPEPPPPVKVAPYQAFYTDLWIQYYGNGDHKPPDVVKGYGTVDIRYWLEAE
ncbi:MAG: hypothetical protein KGM97_01320 [Alphaproteobacteria bacterium]|nr:hypothetical protein [Alphaproteobacteria bacterium]